MQELNLYPGWNLISTYLDIANTDILLVLAPIEGLYRSVWAYDSGSWSRYIPGSPLNNLSAIEPGKGYWINMTDETVLEIPGAQIADTAVPLHQGWNLIGYNSSTKEYPEDVLPPIVYTSIWTYDSTTGIWLKYAVGALSFLNNLIQLEPGKGYWIYVE